MNTGTSQQDVSVNIARNQGDLDRSEKGSSKLTDWENEPSIMDLKKDLEAAQPSHDAQTAEIKRWNEIRDVTGASKPKKVKGRSQIQPRLVRRQAEWRYSALSEAFLGSEKLFEVKPRTFEDTKKAQQNELMLNYQFETQIDKVSFIDNYVRSTVDDGTCIVRLGWRRESMMKTRMVPVFQYEMPQSEEDIMMLQQAVQMSVEDNNSYLNLPEEIQAAVEYMAETGQPAIAVQIGEQEEEYEEVMINQPVVEVTHPDNCIIDPGCQGDYTKARFVIFTYETTKSQMLKDGRFKNLDKVNWAANTVLSQPDHETQTPNSFDREKDLNRPIVAYEYWGYWDCEGNEMEEPISATWIGDTMVRMEKNPFPDNKPPLVVVKYLPRKRELYGEPDAQLLEENQQILGAVTRGMIDLLGRSANSQQGFAKGFLDSVNRRRFETGQDYEFNPGGDPRTSIFQHTYPEIPQSAMLMAQGQNAEAEALSGVKSFSGGVSGTAYGDVAAGIRGALDASSKREMNILRRLARGMQEIGRKIVSMNAVFLQEEEVIRVTNEEFVEIRREDLGGSYDLIVDISTNEVDQARADQLGFMLQTIGPNLDIQMTKMILSEIARLKRMPALAKSIEKYEPQPDPLEEELKKMEVMKMQKEIEKLDSEIAVNMSQAEENRAEARLDAAKAMNELTGVTHQQGMERSQAQARANQNLEVTKGLLKPRKQGETPPDVQSAIGFNELSKMMDDLGAMSPGKGAVTPNRTNGVFPRTPDQNIGSNQFNPALDPATNNRLGL